VDVTIEVTRKLNSGIVVHLTGSVPLEGDFDLRQRSLHGADRGHATAWAARDSNPCPPD
jgi:hypothetical protein